MYASIVTEHRAPAIPFSLAGSTGIALYDGNTIAIRNNGDALIAAMLLAIGVPSGEGPLAMADDASGENAARAFEVRAANALQAAPPYAEWLTSTLAAS